jgi:hypothetical protein
MVNESIRLKIHEGILDCRSHAGLPSNHQAACDGQVNYLCPSAKADARIEQIRNQRLMELGWDVMRFWVYQIRDDLNGSVSRVQRWMDSAGQL